MSTYSDSIVPGVIIALQVIVLLYLVILVSLTCARRTKRQMLVRVFQETASCLNKNGIPYVIFWGTLLGSQREHQIIQNDDDADFVVFGKQNADKAMQVLAAEYGRHRFRKSTPRKFYANANRGLFAGIHVDLQYAERGGDGRWVRSGDPMAHLGIMPENTPERREAVVMHGVTVYKPPDPHALLVELYGHDYMTPIPYKKTDGDPRHDSRVMKFRQSLKKIGLYI